MARRQDFASKVQKQSKHGTVCPTCDTAYHFVKKVSAYYSEKTRSWKYSTQNLKVCKCNEQEVYS
ncbi:MAG: hypothetical protein D6681_00855 [Calditrichaeota bacterium]|nr:MAG: hypothetical protein D6681_00855 [Calditrichota bacterium]